MLATKVSFMNEMANIVEKVRADIDHVCQGIEPDDCISYDFIYLGCRYGGTCFPKDVKVLSKASQVIGISLNCSAPWGLSVKPKTDDMREAHSRANGNTMGSRRKRTSL